MNDCDPYENKFTIHGVEICLIDLHFSHHPEEDMEKIWQEIKKKNPDADERETAAAIRQKIVQWRNSRKK